MLRHYKHYLQTFFASKKVEYYETSHTVYNSNKINKYFGLFIFLWHTKTRSEVCVCVLQTRLMIISAYTHWYMSMVVWDWCHRTYLKICSTWSDNKFSFAHIKKSIIFFSSCVVHQFLLLKISGFPWRKFLAFDKHSNIKNSNEEKYQGFSCTDVM
jgi:hypothetical protein